MPASDQAIRVAVAAALSATTMLFASLASAFLVRRSFPDWSETSPSAWPLALIACAFAASIAVEDAARTDGPRRRRALRALALSSALYLIAAGVVVVSFAFDETGLAAPQDAFVVLLLSLHVVHGLLGAAFATWALGQVDAISPADSVGLVLMVRQVTHFLTVLLAAILFLLYVLP